LSTIKPHKFFALPTNPDDCIICHLGKSAHCARCAGAADKFYESESISGSLCWTCKDWELGQLIAKTDASAQRVSVLAREANDMAGITNTGDFFNAKAQFLIDLRKGIDADETITDKDLAYSEAILARYKHFKDVVFDGNNELLVLGKAIRDFGESQRAEIRAKIQELDKEYQPEKPKMPVKIKGAAKVSPFERMVQTFAATTGKTIEEARKILNANMAPKA
jgi:hypothetical protein